LLLNYKLLFDSTLDEWHTILVSLQLKPSKKLTIVKYILFLVFMNKH